MLKAWRVGEDIDYVVWNRRVEDQIRYDWSHRACLDLQLLHYQQCCLGPILYYVKGEVIYQDRRRR